MKELKNAFPLKNIHNLFFITCLQNIFNIFQFKERLRGKFQFLKPDQVLNQLLNFSYWSNLRWAAENWILIIVMLNIKRGGPGEFRYLYGVSCSWAGYFRIIITLSYTQVYPELSQPWVLLQIWSCFDFFSLFSFPPKSLPEHSQKHMRLKWFSAFFLHTWTQDNG